MFSGSITAIVTPFDGTGAIDWVTYVRLIEHQIEAGNDGIVVAGTTGEGPTLNFEEVERMLTLAVDIAGDQLYVIATTGTYNTQQSVERAHLAKKIGVSGQLVIVPYYNKPTPEGIYRHYAALDAVDLPMILYHHPGRTGVTLDSATIDRIMLLDSLVAIKDCSSNPTLAKKHPVFTGVDTEVRSYLEAGALGTISVIGNLLPEMWHRIVHKRDWPLLETLLPLINAIDLEVNPQGIKCAMELAGLCPARARLPMIEAAEENRQKIAEKLTALQPALI